MSQRNIKRHEPQALSLRLKKVLDGKLTLVQATPALEVCYRQAKQLKKAAKEGLHALVHGNRGRSPANKIDEEMRSKMPQLSQEAAEESCRGVSDAVGRESAPLVWEGKCSGLMKIPLIPAFSPKRRGEGTGGWHSNTPSPSGESGEGD